MLLLTKEILKQLPPLDSGESKGMDALAVLKFFTPDAHWTWYATEFDGKDQFFGLVDGDELELGYFSLSELQEVRGQLGLPVERDRFFQPIMLGKLMEELEIKESRRIRGLGNNQRKALLEKFPD